MNPLFLIAFAIIIICSLAMGFFIFLKPSFTIEIQRRFYTKINWRIEPISLAKEIRNTKIMGLIIIIVTSLSAICVLTQCKIAP